MISSFAPTRAGKETATIFAGTASSHYSSTIQRTALRKLTYVNNATRLTDLLVPPGNGLHAMTGDRLGQHTVKVNDQFRICFLWGEDNNAREVEIVDYHQANNEKKMTNSNHTDSVYTPVLLTDVHADGTPNLAPIHPGEILALDLMEPLGVTAYQLHKATGLTEAHIGQIIHGKRGITAATALRLSAYFGTSATLWTNLQSDYEIRQASAMIGEQVARIMAHPRAKIAASI